MFLVMFDFFCAMFRYLPDVDFSMISCHKNTTVKCSGSKNPVFLINMFSDEKFTLC